MKKTTTPLWFLDETYTYFILQRPLENVKESDIQLGVQGRDLCLKVPGAHVIDRFHLPISIDTRGITWALRDGMLIVSLEKAPLGRAVRVNLKGDGRGRLYGEYNFEHMFPPNNPPEAVMGEE